MTQIKLLLFSVCVAVAFAIQCLDQNNQPVDWFVVYKLPQIKHEHGKLFRSGVAYVYMTSNDNNGWKFSNISINNSQSLLGLTLKPLYDKNNSNVYVLYNDEPPNRRSMSNKGHTKGVVLGDENGGFWLVHSVPHFPLLGSFYTYPLTGNIYGQSFLCMSLNLENLDAVGMQLKYNQPEIYSQNVPTNWKNKIPNLAEAAINVTVTTAPWFHSVTLTTTHGVAFESFAKSKNFNKDLYEDWLAPALNTSLFVETWPNGRDVLPSNCSKLFKIFNVKSITVTSANVTFTSTHDHSKWAVSDPSNPATWICIGDINRMESQKKRGGGTVCFNNKKIVAGYQKCIATMEKC